MFLTETWYQPEVFLFLNETCLPGYCYIQKARSIGHGGGLAVIYCSHLDLSLLVLPELSSFECLAFNCKPPFTMTLLDCLNLRQHVDIPTHIKGNILNLVITESAPLSAPFVYDLGASDHKVISMELPFLSSYVKPKHEIRFRPISNLPFLSKVPEKVVASHLQDHLKHNIFKKFQSGFRSAHNTETALATVTNVLLITADAGSPSLLVLLDLSAAFDTVDHGILLNRLHHSIGLNSVSRWFESYLTDRSEFVAMGSSRSYSHSVGCGVPRGSLL
ncbi:hypothetical protein H4Q32_003256 [Labeo rohita]|uniref:Reverse transcriptase domain-containing protein n=1 Tax=Labeo rohita TaxID=84645 RepID=A0ABQ8MQF7_LABRO|nr:hypothetical protein H4Q32_003256 [Labeo rohita]